jgi:transcriptional regulator with XRE-family HTH domain
VNESPYPNGLADCMALVEITDPQLAALAGTTKQQIFKLRRGERKLTVQWARRLAPYLKVTWQELIEGPASPTDRNRSDLLHAFDVADATGREMLMRLARSVTLDAEHAAEAERAAAVRSDRPEACIKTIPARPKRA